MIRRETFFFGTAPVAMAIAAIVMWLIVFAPPAGCRQIGLNKFLSDQPMSGPYPPGQLQA